MKKTVVITGVTRGLGRAMANEFINLGHTVCGCARTKDQIESLAGIYPQHDFQRVDVSSDAQVQVWAKNLERRYGQVDFVINNAAVINHKASLWNVRNQDFSEVVDTNVKGVVNVIRHFAPSMIKNKKGIFVNFSSRWGKTFEKEMAPYCATKWAVVAITQVVAEELRVYGIAVVALNPGIVKTRMLGRYLGTRFGSNASNYLTPPKWAKIAVPLILNLGLKDTGKIRKVSTPQTLKHTKPLERTLK